MQLAVLDDSALLEADDDLDALSVVFERQALEDNLLDFVKQAWHIIEPGVEFVSNWHIEELCKVLTLVTQRKLKRVIINVPPGTMKSLLVSVLWPAWMWARDPKLRMLSASYGQDLTTDFNLKVRDIVQSAWFQRYWPLKLSEDQNAKTRYNTDQGGYRHATSVGGAGTGKHPDVIIIDDALKANQANSAVELEAPNKWFDDTISTRGVVRNVAIVVVGQRLNENDLPGYLLTKDPKGWTLVKFPMRYERCTCPPDANDETKCVNHKADPNWAPDPRDHRTEEGELLWPAVFPEEKVRQLELDLGPYGAAGQLQQRPSPEGGGLFKRAWFKFASAAPKLARRARGWDTAATENGGDWTCGVRASEEFELRGDSQDGTKPRKPVNSGRFYIEHVARERLGPSGVDKLIRATAEADGKETAVREEKEGGSAGKAVIEARTKLMVGFDYVGVTVTGSKVVRAKPFRAQVEGGNVYIVRTGNPDQDAWIEPYLAELCHFPTGKNDDQVDGSSCAFNAVLLEPPPVQHKATW